MTSLSFTTNYRDVNYYIEADVTIYPDSLGVPGSDFKTYDIIDLRAFNDETMAPVVIYEVLGLRDAVRDDLNYHLGRLGYI